MKDLPTARLHPFPVKIGQLEWETWLLLSMKLGFHPQSVHPTGLQLPITTKKKTLISQVRVLVFLEIIVLNRYQNF